MLFWISPFLFKLSELDGEAQSKRKDYKFILISFQVRLLLQLLLTILFIIYFGLPSVDRFLMKRVRSVHNSMLKLYFKSEGI